MSTVLKIEAPVEKLFDLSMIDKFCRGDYNLTKKMIQVFINDIPFSVEEIKHAYQQKDFIALKKVAHRIKPVLSMYSIVKIEKEIELMENLDKDEKITPELGFKINKLDSVISLVTQQMNTYIS